MATNLEFYVNTVSRNVLFLTIFTFVISNERKKLYFRKKCLFSVTYFPMQQDINRATPYGFRKVRLSILFIKNCVFCLINFEALHLIHCQTKFIELSRTIIKSDSSAKNRLSEQIVNHSFLKTNSSAQPQLTCRGRSISPCHYL